MTDQKRLQLGPSKSGLDYNLRMVEAAHYSLMRRLAPAIRHEIAGSFQPLRTLSTVLEKQLQQSEPNIDAIIKNSVALSKVVKEASGVCTEMTTWLTPKKDLVSALVCINESIEILSKDLLMRGFTLDPVTQYVQAELNKCVLQPIFCMCVIALTDMTKAPAMVRVTVGDSEQELLITISVESVQTEDSLFAIASYRQIDWDDVRLVAVAEKVGLQRLPNGAELRFPLSTHFQQVDFDQNLAL